MSETIRTVGRSNAAGKLRVGPGIGKRGCLMFTVAVSETYDAVLDAVFETFGTTPPSIDQGFEVSHIRMPRRNELFLVCIASPPEPHSWFPNIQKQVASLSKGGGRPVLLAATPPCVDARHAK
jgi:hypothetical protein